MRRPFTLVDWRTDCMGALAELIPLRTGGDMREALVLFPHQRPRRHLLRRMARDPCLEKPLFPPRMAGVGQWLPGLRRELDPRPLATAGPLDRAGLLYEVVAGLRGEGRGLLASLPLARDRFFPWGARLAELMEELARHALTPANLANLGGEVLPMAEALLEQLGEIFSRYEAALAERGWTTPGLDERYVAAHADEAAEAVGPGPAFIVGFYALTGAEEAVFRALWERGAEVVLHTDPALSAGDAAGHWACREHALWMRSWGARAEVFAPDGEAPRAGGPDLRLYEGFDLHSQLSALRAELDAAPAGDTAVVLPDTSGLMPVLHHLPVKDVNISMGYPLARSSLNRLLETVLRLQETAAGPGRYHWREVIALIRHPYVKMLEPVAGAPVRGLLRELERSVRGGGRYLDPLAWEPALDSLPPGAVAEGADPEAALRGVRAVLAACVENFAHTPTPEALGRALLHLARTLAPAHGADLWRRFPIDAECLYRLSSSLIPALTNSYISQDPMDRAVLYAILRRLLEAERVPFEAEPLTGLQVLGMLESRLLRFARVLVLDAEDDKLPGGQAHDPLLPDSLRMLLGLPDSRQRGLVAAYNFHRLAAGAEEVRVFYQAGESAGDKAGKPVRSRFVEQLLWEKEKQLKRIVRPGDGGPLEAVALPVASLPPLDGGVDKTPAVQARLEDLLRTREISATFLDSYLHCPARFFHERLTPLREPEAVNEEGDPREAGQLVHDVLQSFFEPHVGAHVNVAGLDPAPLLDDFSDLLRHRAFFTQMPYDMRLGLEMSGRRKLARFLKNSVETTILALERDVSAALDVDGRELRVKGRMDRVDQRPEGRVILDYKTGSVAAPAQTLWQDGALWDALEGEQDPDGELMAVLAARLSSVQLPLYCWLLGRADGTMPHNAAWVELKDQGREIALFSDKTGEDVREDVITRRAPALVRFLVRRMLGAARFEARPGPRCAYCPHGFACPAPPKAGRRS
ncbi:PD-(D/E)XK nuclease family protein [Desulfocurvus sp. DL9XJH121]